MHTMFIGKPSYRHYLSVLSRAGLALLLIGLVGIISACSATISTVSGTPTATTAAGPASTPTATPKPVFTPGPAHVVVTILPSSYCSSHASTCGTPPLKTSCSTNSYPNFRLDNNGGESTNFGIGEGDAIPGSGLPSFSPGLGTLAPGQSLVIVFSAPSFGPSKVLGYNVAVMWGQGHDQQYTVTCL